MSAKWETHNVACSNNHVENSLIFVVGACILGRIFMGINQLNAWMFWNTSIEYGFAKEQ